MNRSRIHTHRCAVWIRELKQNGKTPVIILLAKVKCWERGEKQWIAKLKSQGLQLLNMTSGGGGSNGFKQSKESITKIRAAAKRQFSRLEARKAAALYGRQAWDNPASRRKLVAARRKMAKDPKFVKKQSEAKIRLWKTRKYRSAVCAAQRKVDRRKIALEFWQRRSYRDAQKATWTADRIERFRAASKGQRRTKAQRARIRAGVVRSIARRRALNN